MAAVDLITWGSEQVILRLTQVGVLDVTEKLDSTCRQLEQQYGIGRVQRLQCDVTDSTKLVNEFLLVFYKLPCDRF